MMRNKLMKTKIMAIAMAAVLGAAGAAATAQAAAAEEGCQHVNLVWIQSEQSAEFYDRQKHILFNNEFYECVDCGAIVEEKEIFGYEDHDYEQIYYEDGTCLTYCTGCGDSYPF